MGKVEMEVGDLPRGIGIRGHWGGISMGKVRGMKVDLPHSPLGLSPNDAGTFPRHHRGLPQMLPGPSPGITGTFPKRREGGTWHWIRKKP